MRYNIKRLLNEVRKGMRQRFVLLQTKALVIPHILRELNSIIVLSFICIIHQTQGKRLHCKQDFLFEEAIWHRTE